MNSGLMRWVRKGLLFLSAFIFFFGLVEQASAQGADLAVTKNTDSTFVPAGANVSYEISVSNFSGSDSVPNNVLIDNIPSDMTFVSATVAAGWNCTTPSAGMGGTITCTYESAIANETFFLFNFVFQVKPGTADGTVITNTASISHAGTDPNSENNQSSASITVGQPPPPPPPPLAPKDVLISEFRLSGPGGSEDDFIELYCNRAEADCDISGASLRGYDPIQQVDVALTFPGQTIIPARHYLLVVDSRGYTLSGYGTADFDVALNQPPPSDPPVSFSFFDNEGIQLVTADEPVVLDSVGFVGSGNDQYIEGTGLPRAEARPADQYSYVRKRTTMTNGLPQDTDNNAQDFVLVSVTGNSHSGNPVVLGAPGPQGRQNPRSYSNAQVTGNLTDPEKSKEADPNRVRVGAGDSGTLSIRRSFTNNTNDAFTYLGFRVIEISTLHSPNTFGNQADLRLISSTGTTATVPSRGGTVPIFGTVLEYDAACACPQPQQPNGGGLNSSVRTDLGRTDVAPGSTIDVQFLMNVVKAGVYRFYVYAEAVPGVVIEGSSPVANSTSVSARSTSKPAAKFASMRRLPKATVKPAKVRPPVSTKSGPGLTPSLATPTPRLFIINRGAFDVEKKPRGKKRTRIKSSAALKKKAEEKNGTAAKAQN